MALIPRMDVYTQLILLSGTYPSAARKVYLSSGPEEVSQSMWIEAKDADVVPAGREHYSRSLPRHMIGNLLRE
jgi:hypothetical protein